MSSDLNTLLQMANVLFNDAQEARSCQPKDKTKKWFYRRTYVRALFAYFEGTCFFMRQYALRKMLNNQLDHGDILTVAALKEESVAVDEKGEPRAQKLRTPFRNNIVLSFQILSRVDGVQFKFDRSGKGYQAFDESIRIRDRITHPKSKTDLDITDEEMKTLHAATKWFLDLLEPLHACDTERNPAH